MKKLPNGCTLCLRPYIDPREPGHALTQPTLSQRAAALACHLAKKIRDSGEHLPAELTSKVYVPR